MEFKYCSTREVFGAKRSVVMSGNGMVASSHPLASLAGIEFQTVASDPKRGFSHCFLGLAEENCRGLDKHILD